MSALSCPQPFASHLWIMVRYHSANKDGLSHLYSTTQGTKYCFSRECRGDAIGSTAEAAAARVACCELLETGTSKDKFRNCSMRTMHKMASKISELHKL